MYGLAALDVIFVAVLLFSAAIGVLRGFVSEALSLAIWATASMSAYRFGALVGEWLGVGDGALRTVAGGATVFLGLFLVGALVRGLMGRLVNAVGLGGADRVLGLAFGGARGLLVCLVAVVSLQPLVEHTDWWGASLLQPVLQDLAHQLLDAMASSDDHSSHGVEGEVL